MFVVLENVAEDVIQIVVVYVDLDVQKFVLGVQETVALNVVVDVKAVVITIVIHHVLVDVLEPALENV